MRRLDVARSARRDIETLLWESRTRHGARAADRYRRLIDAALADLRQDPARPSASPVDGASLWLYALRISARRLDAAHRVNAPPNVIAYRFDDKTVRIVRLLHEAMDLPRHLPVGAAGRRVRLELSIRRQRATSPGRCKIRESYTLRFMCASAQFSSRGALR